MSVTESYTSPYLASSLNSLNGARHRTKKPKKVDIISTTYKHASQLYLTRRLSECYSTLQPIVKPPIESSRYTDNGNLSQSEDDHERPLAPIASATTSYRIKTWVLYTTLLSAIIELGDEEGKRDFGNKLYRDLVRSVQTGDIWNQVVQDGYAGRESSVDAEVVYNLSNLLLAHAPDQSFNQTRLETYLSSSINPSLDLSTFSQTGTNSHQKHVSSHSGLNTPRDLNSRIKILELFILHVLPANKEWEYAKSFVQNSDILEEERREALLATLDELREAKDQEEAELQAEKERDLVGFAEQTEEDEPSKIQMNEDGDTNIFHDFNPQRSPSRRPTTHRQTSSEVDYGIGNNSTAPTSTSAGSHDKPILDSAVSTTTAATVPPPSFVSQSSSTPQDQHPSPSRQLNKRSISRKHVPIPKPAPRSRIQNILTILSNLTTIISQTLTRNPSAVFRTIMFAFALLIVLAKKEVRERLKRSFAAAWSKVMATAKMGGTVSYI